MAGNQKIVISQLKIILLSDKFLIMEKMLNFRVNFGCDQVQNINNLPVIK